MVCEQKFKLKKNGEPSYRCYCRHPELIENYDKAVADTTQVYETHHRLETHTSDGERRLVELTREELIALGVYYDRPASELILLTASEHGRLHNKGKKRGPRTEETKRKMSEAHKGKFINRKDLSKKVICVETCEVFESVRDAERATGTYHGSISMACKGKLKTTGGYTWKFKK
jgi:hypothetical protein